MKCFHGIALTIVGIGMVSAATDLWDLPPLRYSDTPATDTIAKLAGGADINGLTPLDKPRFVLKLLKIPEESQMLVFSKTNKQNPLIQPGNPRCLFFNENSYVGYVPGGNIEVIAHEKLLGSVYYIIEPGESSHASKITRDTSDCLSCHGTARTESIPGVLVHSFFPDDHGQPLLSPGTFQSDHTSPLWERWSGYYITGRSSLPHLGNQIHKESSTRVFPTESPELTTLAG